MFWDSVKDELLPTGVSLDNRNFQSQETEDAGDCCKTSHLRWKPQCHSWWEAEVELPSATAKGNLDTGGGEGGVNYLQNGVIGQGGWDWRTKPHYQITIVLDIFCGENGDCPEFNSHLGGGGGPSLDLARWSGSRSGSCSEGHFGLRVKGWDWPSLVV